MSRLENIRNYFATVLKNFWQARYQNYLAESEDDDGGRLEISRQYAIDAADAPSAAQEAYKYYLQGVQEADWGNVYLFKVPLDGINAYVIRVTTDGDDGWLELFDEAGAALGTGRTYIELIAWGPPEQIRCYVNDDNGFPPELADRQEKTLWGK